MISGHLTSLGRMSELTTQRQQNNSQQRRQQRHFISVSAAKAPAVPVVHPPRVFSKADCQTYLQAYVACMESHQGVKPDAYQMEWCASEKNMYLYAREQFKKQSAGQQTR